MASAALVALVAVAPSAEATVLRGLTVGQLRSRAELIVEGRVVQVRSERAEGRIETVAVVRVRATHKGDEVRQVEVRALGGHWRGRRMIVPGAARFAAGDRVLLFLYADAENWRPVGMFQGVWHVDSTRRAARASDSGGASLLRPLSGSAAVERPDQSVARLLGTGGAR